MTNDYKLGYVTGRSDERKIILDILAKLINSKDLENTDPITRTVNIALVTLHKDLGRELPDIF